MIESIDDETHFAAHRNSHRRSWSRLKIASAMTVKPSTVDCRAAEVIHVLFSQPFSPASID